MFEDKTNYYIVIVVNIKKFMFKPGDRVRPNASYAEMPHLWSGNNQIPLGIYTVHEIGKRSVFSIKEYPERGAVWSEPYWELAPRKEEQVRKLLSKLDEKQAETNLESIDK